jgi:hypothetical protein
MSKDSSATFSMTDDNDETALVVNLKDPRIAAFLAWLVPGLGHLYQGRTAKGLLFVVCIVGTFVYGLMIGEGRVVYAADVNPLSRRFYDRWQYLCQVGVGLPALPALLQTQRRPLDKPPKKAPLIHDKFMRPPVMVSTVPGLSFESRDDSNNVVRHPHELAKWHYDLGDRFELGTVFTVIAGLLNILAIYDAHGGPLVILPSKGNDNLKTNPA